MRFSEFSNGWETRKLEEIAEIITGTTPPINNESYYEGEYLFVSPRDIQKNRYVESTKATLTEKGFKKGRKIRKGSSLFVCIGSTIGKLGQAQEDCITNQQINSVIPFGNDDDFIFSLLEYYSPKIRLLSAEQAVPIINKTTFSKVEVKIPTLKEQQKISSFLSQIDTRIHTQSKILQSYQTLRQSIKERILTQKIRFKDSFGNCFPDWKKIKLEELCEKQSSNISANKIEDNFGEFPIYGATGVLKNVDFYEVETEYIAIIKDGAGVGRLFLCEQKSSVLGTLDIIKPKNINLYFLYCLLSNIDFNKYTTGSTIPHIYFKDYKNEFCMIPCEEEQTKIASFLSSIDQKIETEKEILNQLENQKKYLLQNLFV